MARKSADARAAGAFQAGAAVPQPPKHLSTDAKAVWKTVVAAKPVDWWDHGNLLLLESYCDIVVRLRRARVDLDTYGDVQETKMGRGPSAELQVVDKLNKQMVALATKLRLTIQSALRGDSAKVKERGPGAIDDNLLGGNVTALRRA